MKKNIIYSSILLLIGGFITKALGMIIKIMMSRNIGIDGLSLYMLVLPTFSFCILLGQAGFPFTLSRMVAYKNNSISSLYFTSLIFLIIYNVILSIVLILLAPTISLVFLKNNEAYLPLIGIALVIPFTTLSNTLKSYFIGNQKIFPTVLSNITENILRLIFIIWILPKIHFYSISYLVFTVILFNIISESIASLILIIFLPKKKIKITFQRPLLKESLKSSVPQLCSTLIGNGTYFLEPIILFHFLSKYASISYITQEYGIITGYVLPLIFLPTFFITTMQQVLLPTITQLYKNKKEEKILSIIKLESIIIFLFSIFISIMDYLFAKDTLNLLYHTSLGINYLQLLSFFIFFLYLEPIFQYTWIAIGKTKEILMATTFSSVIRITSLIILLILKFGIYSLLLSLIINILFTTIFEYQRMKLYLTKKEDFSSI